MSLATGSHTDIVRLFALLKTFRKYFQRRKNDTQFVICIDTRMVSKRPANQQDFGHNVPHAEQMIGFFGDDSLVMSIV